jgi:hypothetical protein
MGGLKKGLSYICKSLDQRPELAREWLDSAEKYEEKLRENVSNPQLAEAILQEVGRIRALFTTLIPTYKDHISVVVMRDTHAEHCAVFSWKDHLYILVSAALIGRPIDHPQDQGLPAWEWLAHHELAHIRGGHLPWFFYTRKVFQWVSRFCLIMGSILFLFSSTESRQSWFKPFLWMTAITWLIQTFVGLFFEWKADLAATQAVNDPVVLKEAEKSLIRMSGQAVKRWPSPWGRINYTLNMLFVDPHPPLSLRLWLLKRRQKSLEKAKKTETGVG